MSAENEAAAGAVSGTQEGHDLLDEIVEASKLKPGETGYDMTRAGLQTFLAEFITTNPEAKITGALVDDMIVELDRKITAQVNAVMHDETFRKLESSWRGLKYLVDQTDFQQNNKIQFM
ncbi:MAG: type VI secretion system contractile sheath large subunit, partial [Candidatus Adiutrix sp.]|nr:type VI secretion system contractile sheath large subunit [Candidatus Adiutrix sp.]